MEQGVVIAIVWSLIEIIRRQYRPKDFVVGVTEEGGRAYVPATPGRQSEPGLVIFRYDAELFYANVSRFVDDVEGLVQDAPDPVEWLVLDAAPIDDIDYSAGISLAGLLDWLDARHITLALARADTSFVRLLEVYALRERIADEHVYPDLQDAVAGFRARRTDPIGRR